MEPSKVSSTPPNASLLPTPEEIEAGASLTQAPERLESRATDEPPAPAPAVQSLIERHAAATAPRTLPQAASGNAEGKSLPHHGIALSVGTNIAVGPGYAVGAELNLGVVVDLTEPKISLFASDGWGTAEAPVLSAGASAQVSYVDDIEKFWGSGRELGVNVPAAGFARSYTTPEPGGEPQPNARTLSAGPSIGADIHDFETSTERVSMSWNDVKNAFERAMGLPGPRRFGP